MPLQLRRASGEDLVAAQQCYKLSNVHPPTSYEVRGSPLTAPTLAFPPPVLAYCCSRGLLFTIVVHQGYCCSVVTVNNNNTVQKLTFGNSNGGRLSLCCRGAPAGAEAPGGRRLGACVVTGWSHGTGRYQSRRVLCAARGLLTCGRSSETPGALHFASAGSGVQTGSAAAANS